MMDLVRMNLLSPLILAFALGVAARAMRSELSLPKDLYTSLSIYLLLAIGLKGGVELSEASIAAFALPASVTVLLGLITPVTTYVALRKIGRFSVSDSAGIAAHYGSVSAVTFIAAQQFVSRMGASFEGYTAALLTLLESPGIHLALAIGAFQRVREARLATATVVMSGGGVATLGGPGTGAVWFGPTEDPGPHANPVPSPWATLREVLTARTMILLVGGLAIGVLIGRPGYEPIKPFFDGGFKGALTLFLLEMGLLAGSKLKDLREVGLFLLGFGIVTPVVHGLLGVALARWAGMSPGGATILGAMAASASYIAAPPAVRLNLPEANPTYSLTLALVVTFPFNLLVGIPLFFEAARRLG